METIDVEKIQRLDVKPGETLVVTVPGRSTPEYLQRVVSIIKNRLPDGVEVLVVSSGIELGVVARVETAEAVGGSA